MKTTQQIRNEWLFMAREAAKYAQETWRKWTFLIWLNWLVSAFVIGASIILAFKVHFGFALGALVAIVPTYFALAGIADRIHFRDVCMRNRQYCLEMAHEVEGMM